MQSRTTLLVLLLLLPFACNASDGHQNGTAAQAAQRRAVAQETQEAEAELPRVGPKKPGIPRVVFLGDSVTHGQGLESQGLAYPALIQEHLRSEGTIIEAINAGVSGDNTARGHKRLGPLMELQPDVVVVALGGNDAAHDQPLAEAREHLEAIIEEARRGGARVLLVGLHFPPYIAPDTGKDFERMFLELAQQERVPFVPNMMEGCFGQPGMLQNDLLHPTAAGQKRVAENIEPGLVKLLEELKV